MAVKEEPPNAESQIIVCKASEVTVEDPENLKVCWDIKKTQSGDVKEKHFCGRCGCTLWTIPMHHGGAKWMIRVPLIHGALVVLQFCLLDAAVLFF